MSIEYAALFQKELDQAAVAAATSGWMEANAGLVKYSGGREVKIPKVAMDGLADYDRAKGFVDGSVTFEYQTVEMTQDRGRRFQIDENDVDETGFALTAASLMGEFQNTKVIPEIDAYRYSTIAQKCIAGAELAGYGYTPSESSILKTLLDDIAKVQDIAGETAALVISMSIPVWTVLNNSEKLQKRLDVTDFQKGDVTTRVKSLDGMYPIIPVPSARMKTKYTFNDGTTSGQEKGGFAAAADALDINWIIMPRTAPIAVSKTDKMRIFDPETNQDARAWRTDYRKYHDIWIPSNKLAACYTNIKQAKPASGGTEEKG